MAAATQTTFGARSTEREGNISSLWVDHTISSLLNISIFVIVSWCWLWFLLKTIGSFAGEGRAAPFGTGTWTAGLTTAHVSSWSLLRRVGHACSEHFYCCTGMHSVCSTSVLHALHELRIAVFWQKSLFDTHTTLLDDFCVLRFASECFDLVLDRVGKGAGGEKPDGVTDFCGRIAGDRRSSVQHFSICTATAVLFIFLSAVKSRVEWIKWSLRPDQTTVARRSQGRKHTHRSTPHYQHTTLVPRRPMRRVSVRARRCFSDITGACASASGVLDARLTSPSCV